MSLPTSATGLRHRAAGTLMPGFPGVEIPDWILQAYDQGLGAVCLYGDNVASPTQLRQLCAGLRARAPHALLAIDEEGGDVTRLHYLTGSDQPGNAVLGRIDDTALTEASAAAIGSALTGYGINLNLAPVADVNSAPENPVIGVRSFGADPQLVARHTAAWVAGLESAGVASCSKHFPGHGDTTADSHMALPRIQVDAETLLHRELVPFRAVTRAGGASIMTSHILVDALDPEHPATFSPIILQNLLRKGLGYRGAIITDALDMAGASAETGIPEAAVKALLAGSDLLCLGSGTSERTYRHCLDAIVEAVETGRLPEARLDDALARNIRLAAGFPATPPTSMPPDTAGIGTDDSAISSAFTVEASATRWMSLSRPAAILQLETEANMAVGHVPWGASAVGATTTEESLVPGMKVAVLARGLHAGHPANDVVQRLRTDGYPVILVDCGWPHAPADLVTFGASRAVGQVLTSLLLGTSGPSSDTGLLGRGGA
ncbi:glycoside hydrolase family 3 protein [Arthrobacter rhombi]|uniref:glycoside hydrolase family 3 protein n=1 Tax=Arthrobacter rhombi TaxID=71253 RepID=UPI003FD56E8B